jgi:HrpA-like RNA helicase
MVDAMNNGDVNGKTAVSLRQRARTILEFLEAIEAEIRDAWTELASDGKDGTPFAGAFFHEFLSSGERLPNAPSAPIELAQILTPPSPARPDPTAAIATASLLRYLQVARTLGADARKAGREAQQVPQLTRLAGIFAVSRNHQEAIKALDLAEIAARPTPRDSEEAVRLAREDARRRAQHPAQQWISSKDDPSYRSGIVQAGQRAEISRDGGEEWSIGGVRDVEVPVG